MLVGSEGSPLPGGSGLTTPGPVEFQRVLRLLVDAGVRRVAMEVSSHALDQRRVEGVRFDAAVFTNLTRDHLDYHGTMEAYLAAKARLIAHLSPGGAAVVNDDVDSWHALPPAPRLVRYGLASPRAEARASGATYGPEGSRWVLRLPDATAEVSLPLIGDFNVANALAAAAAAWALGHPGPEIARALARLPQVPGRLERVLDHPTVLRDYAHKPDALERALRAVRPFTPGRLIVVFGCGGDRDRGKRPIMGGIAEREADVVILTSDNPPHRGSRAHPGRDRGRHAAPTRAHRGPARRDRTGAGHGRAGRRRGPGGEGARDLPAPGERDPAIRREGDRAGTGVIGARHAGDVMSGFWTLSRVAQALDGELAGARPEGHVPLTAIVTDTRHVAPGDVFVALVGERFDGHDFVREAVSRGAVAVVVADGTRATGLGVPAFVVHDTTRALGSLGRYRRRAWGGPVVAVAGSNGKTSTKELIAAALGAGYDVHATRGNLNNQVGVPLTLLAIPDSAQVAVIEVGTDHPGEVAALRALVEPDVAVVTSIGEEHLEGLGDLDGVLREECAIFQDVARGIAPAGQPEVAREGRARGMPGDGGRARGG